jgi:hypothetical protein
VWGDVCVTDMSETFLILILRRIEGDIIKVHSSSCNVPVILDRS